ncbi:MAG: DUF5615 family PIN-like protein [Chloroflexia bacterium]
MLKLLADEHVPMQLILGLLRREPDLDIVRVQDGGLHGWLDPDLLEWAAEEERIVVTYDVNTMLNFASQRVAEGKRMPGVVAIPWSVSLAQAIDDILTLAIASLPNEWEGQVKFFPL